MSDNIKTLEQTLNSNGFAITAEIPAPISASAVEMEQKIDLLKGYVHAVNVTDNPGATAHMSSLAGCNILRNKGIDVKNISRLSDGCAAQFKSRHCNGDLRSLPQSLSVKQLTWNYYESHEGKNLSDTLGSLVKHSFS